MLPTPTSFHFGAPPPDSRHAERLIAALVSGGDGRIRLDAQGRNQYHASATPSDAIAYDSSTINSISHHAFRALMDQWGNRLDGPFSATDYAEGLDVVRKRLAAWIGLSDPSCAEIVFAASGTDLEYVGLAAAWDGRPLTAVLLGSGLIDQSQKMTVAARATAEKKAFGHRS